MTATLVKPKERPILFSVPMVKAILKDRDGKTQTRRIVNIPPFDPCDDGLEIHATVNIEKCPYGKVGDRLWVREAWRPYSWGSDFDWMMIQFAAGGDNKHIDPFEVWDSGLRAESLWEQLSEECIKAKCPRSEDGNFTLVTPDGNFPIKWRPSIFMPRAISRITLEITEVRLQRLQDITEEDAIAEGVTEALSEDTYSGCPLNQSLHGDIYFAKWGFKFLWDSINAKTYPWDSNPWVWCISFKRIN